MQECHLLLMQQGRSSQVQCRIVQNKQSHSIRMSVKYITDDMESSILNSLFCVVLTTMENPYWPESV